MRKLEQAVSVEDHPKYSYTSALKKVGDTGIGGRRDPIHPTDKGVKKSYNNTVHQSI